MDLDQIIKRLEWLDDERRKDKITLATLEERLASVEAGVSPLAGQIKDLAGDITRLSALVSRYDQIDASLAQIRVDFNRSIETIEKTRLDRERETEKIRRADLESLAKSTAEVRKGLEPISDIKKSLQARVEEEFRLGRLIEELEHKFNESNRVDEEYRRTQRLLDEGRKQDAKRISDMQGEVGAMRKRLDEQRGKVELAGDSMRKLELRLSEVLAAEVERRQSQVAFIEKQNMNFVERERVWKEWQTKFEEITQKAANLDTQVQSLESTHRAVKRSQEAFDEITQRFDRRMNEVTEMQRLVEERFRQEWVTFKADDQKRWTNYTLAQEEQQREVTRQFQKYQERFMVLEDMTQEVRDLQQQILGDIEKRLQGMVALAQQWIEDYDRTFGRSR